MGKVYAYARRDLQANAKLNHIQSSETSSWPQTYPRDAQVFYSGLGTTRALAGGFENQHKIDYDLNLELAKAAKAAGTKVYVLISAGGANSSSLLPYVKMKGQLEDAVQELGFDHTIIVRPGLIIGARQESQTRLAELAFQKIAGAANAINYRLQDFWAQDAEVSVYSSVEKATNKMTGHWTRSCCRKSESPCW